MMRLILHALNSPRRWSHGAETVIGSSTASRLLVPAGDTAPLSKPSQALMALTALVHLQS